MVRLYGRGIALMAAIFAGAAGLGVAGPAAADSFRFGIGVDAGPRYYRAPAYYPPRPVYVVPPPVYMPPPPVVYAPPPPVVYAPPPPPATYYAPTRNGYCREYQSQQMVGGVPQTVVGTACQQPDGTWRIIN